MKHDSCLVLHDSCRMLQASCCVLRDSCFMLYGVWCLPELRAVGVSLGLFLFSRKYGEGSSAKALALLHKLDT